MDDNDIVSNRVFKYYDLEKKTGLLIISFSTICLVSPYLTESILPKRLYISMMLPIRIMALIQLAIGLVILVTNSQKEKEWKNIDQENRFSFLIFERKRVKKIDTNLRKLSNVFMVLILLSGLFIILGFVAKWGDFSIGTGIGLLIPSAVIYLIDQYRAFNVGTHLSFLNRRPK